MYTAAIEPLPFIGYSPTAGSTRPEKSGNVLELKKKSLKCVGQLLPGNV